MKNIIRISCLTFAVGLSGCASHGGTAAPCPEDPHDHGHGAPEHSHAETHSHDHSPLQLAKAADRGVVIPHDNLPSFSNNGNTLVGLATGSMGASKFEVWRSTVAPGGQTPLHVHETEEVFLVLAGKGEMLVGDQVIQFEAPATVIAPAGIPHQLRNTGDVPTDQIVIVGVGSVIKDADGRVMQLPWRK